MTNDMPEPDDDLLPLISALVRPRRGQSAAEMSALKSELAQRDARIWHSIADQFSKQQMAPAPLLIVGGTSYRLTAMGGSARRFRIEDLSADELIGIRSDAAANPGSSAAYLALFDTHEAVIALTDFKRAVRLAAASNRQTSGTALTPLYAFSRDGRTYRILADSQKHVFVEIDEADRKSRK